MVSVGEDDKAVGRVHSTYHRRGTDFSKTPKRGEPWKLRANETTDDTISVNWLERRRGEIQISLWT